MGSKLQFITVSFTYISLTNAKRRTSVLRSKIPNEFVTFLREPKKLCRRKHRTVQKCNVYFKERFCPLKCARNVTGIYTNIQKKVVRCILQRPHYSLQQSQTQLILIKQISLFRTENYVHVYTFHQTSLINTRNFYILLLF